MIINTLQSDIEVIGDAKEFKTSIDSKNLEFITTLLSSNLYSNPEQSFIREIVSNAWDSHVEAGTTDTPVIINYTKNNYLWDITIRDYGTGLSPERFNTVFRNIGSSTKRESNKYIGAFGIGHLSPFACSNTVYITSYYNGTAYYYIGSKSNNTITYHRLMEKPTKERNGVEVTIKGISNINPYTKALDCVVFFPNIYISGSTIERDKINNAKLKRFNNFAATTIRLDSRLLLGNVLYSVNNDLLSYDSKQFISNLINTGIVIKFDIGEIDVTPNRESIIYNSKSINKIEERIKAAQEELLDMIYREAKKDYDDLKEYKDTLTSTQYYNPITNKFENYNYYYNGYRIEFTSLNKIITFRGKDLKCVVNKISMLLNCELPNYKGVSCDNKILNKRLPYKVSHYNSLKSPNILILNSDVRITELIKNYIRENYDCYSIIKEISYSEFYKWVKNELIPYFNETDPVISDLIIKGAYDSLMKRAKKLDINTDKGYLDYKAIAAENKIRNSIEKEKEAIIYEWDYNGWRNKKQFKKLSQALEYLKRLKCGIILANMNTNSNMLCRIAQLKDYILIQARKDIVNDIRKLNPSYIVDLDWLTEKDPLIAKVKATILHFPDTLTDTSIINEICDNVSEQESKDFKYIVRLRKAFGDDLYYRGIVDKANVKCDPYTEYMCRKLKEYLSKHLKAKNLVYESNLDEPVLVTAAIIKTKAYRVNNRAYQRVRNNKLLRILCKK